MTFSIIHQKMKPLRWKFIVLMLLLGNVVYSQDTAAVAEAAAEPAKPKPVKNTFESIWIIDNQTVMVPSRELLNLISSTGLEPGIMVMKIFMACSLLRISAWVSTTVR
jgi:hypothetical protein